MNKVFKNLEKILMNDVANKDIDFHVLSGLKEIITITRYNNLSKKNSWY